MSHITRTINLIYEYMLSVPKVKCRRSELQCQKINTQFIIQIKFLILNVRNCNKLVLSKESLFYKAL